jgi:periplasmic divalent cation tolerance protein
LVPLIIDRANRDHPYEVPCVIAMPVIAGIPAYLQWVHDETADPSQLGAADCDPLTDPRHMSAS